MSVPIVSGLMSVYNGERYLERAVRSILSQTAANLELVCIDDGSTDGSVEILQSIARSDPRLIWKTRPNTGIARAVNEGLALCRGQYIAKMDCDDVSLPDRFERQIAFLDAHPEVVVVGGAWEMIDECDRLLTTLNGPLEDPEIQALALRGHAPLTHSCAMMRKDALDRVGGYDETFKYALDLDLWLRIGEIGKLANLPSPPVARFRLHAGSVSETRRHEQREFARLASEKAWARRGIAGVFDAGEPWRPGTDRDSRHRYALRYGWWAYKSGETATARHYARKAIAALPHRRGGWMLWATTFRPGRTA